MKKLLFLCLLIHFSGSLLGMNDGQVATALSAALDEVNSLQSPLEQGLFRLGQDVDQSLGLQAIRHFENIYEHQKKLHEKIEEGLKSQIKLVQKYEEDFLKIEDDYLEERENLNENIRDLIVKNAQLQGELRSEFFWGVTIGFPLGAAYAIGLIWLAKR